MKKRNKGGDSQDKVLESSQKKKQKISFSGGDPTSGDNVNRDIKTILLEVESKLHEAARDRFTGEIRFTFNLSQGGFSTSYIEKERENLFKKKL